MNLEKIEAHTAEVNSISYLPAEDSFVSIGSDNSIRVWVENKMLRERFGHSLPPSYIGESSNSAPLYLVLLLEIEKTSEELRSRLMNFNYEKNGYKNSSVHELLSKKYATFFTIHGQ